MSVRTYIEFRGKLHIYVFERQRKNGYPFATGMDGQANSVAKKYGSGGQLHPLEPRYNTLELASKISVPRGCGPFGNPPFIGYEFHFQQREQPFHLNRHAPQHNGSKERRLVRMPDKQSSRFYPAFLPR